MLPPTSNMAARVASLWSRRLAREFPTQEALEAYLSEHPKASKDKHWVKGEKPEKKPKDEKSEGDKIDFDPAKHVPEPDVMDFAGEPPPGKKPSIVNRVFQTVKDGVAPTVGDVRGAIGLVTTALSNPGSLTKDEVEKLKKVEQFLKDLAGEGEDDEKPKRPPQIRVPGLSAPAAEMITEHGLTPDDVSRLRDFALEHQKAEEAVVEADPGEQVKREYGLSSRAVDTARKLSEKLRKENENPPSATDIRKGIKDPDIAAELEALSASDLKKVLRPPPKAKSLAQVKKEFLKSVEDPEEKARIQKMDPDAFGDLLAALTGSGRGKKRGSLRERTIRLAYTRPDIRAALLAALGVP